MIEFDQVSMTYQKGAPLALRNVSFTIEDGEFVFIIGHSGSGKSTIVKLLTCEERPLSGTVTVGDYCLNTLKRRWVPYLRRNIGMVFQDFRLISTKTIFENIAFALEIQGFSRKAIDRQVSMVLSTVGLRHRENAFPNELSGGEQQRVAIARAMVNNPAILLADEPTGNLDPVNSETIMALLEEINRSGTTVVVCTHDRELVNRMRKRIIEIDEGYLIRDAQQSVYSEDVTTRLATHAADFDGDVVNIATATAANAAWDDAVTAAVHTSPNETSVTRTQAANAHASEMDVQTSGVNAQTQVASEASDQVSTAGAANDNNGGARFVEEYNQKTEPAQTFIAPTTDTVAEEPDADETDEADIPSDGSTV
ncbi:MAG TPA: cell division ATP-binding protein FtsE [Clostridiaceae bacterium]|nr:cell division ATP-binding protein FtsE [Clostridiaceae bacterium]